MISYRILLIFWLLSLPACGKEQQANPKPENPASLFSEPIDQGEITNLSINEASGLAASHKNPQGLWVHNDSGSEPLLFLLNTQGETLATFYVAGATNRDWEDIAVGPGPAEGESYLYVGEIGDNQAIHPFYTIYRIPEPTVTERNKTQVDTLRQSEAITFVYPDGKRDAETLMIDPLTKDIYIISKRDEYEHIYRAAFLQTTSSTLTLEKTGTLPFKIGGMLEQIVGGDISADGEQILLKSYVQVFYWKRKSAAVSITEWLQEKPVLLPYTVEPQGEAIGFEAGGNGYYTLSEKQGGTPPHLYYYPKK